MKNLYLTLTFCICVCINSVQAAENNAVDPCAEFKNVPQLNMTTSYGRLRYNRDFDRTALTQMGQQYHLTEPGMWVSGLSLFGIDWHIVLDTTTRVASNDTICVLPAVLDVFIGFQEPTIYIDKNLPANSCDYHLVLRHEHQHQQIAVAALEYYMPRIRQEISRQLGRVRPRSVESLSQTETVATLMNNEYVALIAPLVDKFKASMLYEQKKLDNTQNYRFESGICHPRR